MSASFEEDLERELELGITHGEVDVAKRQTDRVAKHMKSYEVVSRPPSVLNLKVVFVFSIMVLGFMIFMIYALFHAGNLHPSVGVGVTRAEAEGALRTYTEADLNRDGKLSKEEILKWDGKQEAESTGLGETVSDAEQVEEENEEKEEAKIAGAGDDEDEVLEAAEDTSSEEGDDSAEADNTSAKADDTSAKADDTSGPAEITAKTPAPQVSPDTANNEEAVAKEEVAEEEAPEIVEAVSEGEVAKEEAPAGGETVSKEEDEEEEEVADEQVAEGQVAKQQVAKQQVAKGQVAKGQVAKQQVAKQQVAKGQVAKGQVAEEEDVVLEEEVAKEEVAKEQVTEQKDAKEQVAKGKVAEEQHVVEEEEVSEEQQVAEEKQVAEEEEEEVVTLEEVSDDLSQVVSQPQDVNKAGVDRHRKLLEHTGRDFVKLPHAVRDGVVKTNDLYHGTHVLALDPKVNAGWLFRGTRSDQKTPSLPRHHRMKVLNSLKKDAKENLKDNHELRFPTTYKNVRKMVPAPYTYNGR